MQLRTVDGSQQYAEGSIQWHHVNLRRLPPLSAAPTRYLDREAWDIFNRSLNLLCHVLVQRQRWFHAHKQVVYHIFDGSFCQRPRLVFIEFYGFLYARVMLVIYWLISNARQTADALPPATGLEMTLSFLTKPITFYFALMGTVVLSLI